MTKKTKYLGPKAVLQNILSLDSDVCEIQLCLASVSDDGVPDIQRVQISKKVAGEFRDIVKKTLTGRKSDWDADNLVVKDYAPQARLDIHQVEHIDLSAHDSIGSQIAGLANIENLDLFKENPKFVKHFRFYVMVLRPKKGKPILFFRTYTSKKELSRSAWFAIVLKQGQYDRLTDNLYLFDQHVDCIARGDDLFIFKKDNFQKIFRFYEMLKAAAEKTLRVVKRRIPIDNFPAFEESCKGHLQKLAKVNNIASSPYLRKVTMADLKKVIKRYDLPIQTVGKGKNERIKYNASDRWAILRLLDDDYLESFMTGNPYEVNSKRLMKKPPRPPRRKEAAKKTPKKAAKKAPKKAAKRTRKKAAKKAPKKAK